jgi:hypothetical protein
MSVPPSSSYSHGSPRTLAAVLSSAEAACRTWQGAKVVLVVEGIARSSTATTTSGRPSPRAFKLDDEPRMWVGKLPGRTEHETAGRG